jgi:hypothetical protein
MLTYLDSFSLAGPTRVSRGIKLTGITCKKAKKGTDLFSIPVGCGH